MKRIAPLYRYLVSETVKPVCVFYGIQVFILTLYLLINFFFIDSRSTRSQISGLAFASTIFLFVAGLNSFKSGFLFACNTGYVRRQYFAAAALMLLTAATVMTVMDVWVDVTVRAIDGNLLYNFPVVYVHNTIAELTVWHWAMNLEAVSLGLCITLAFYRLNKAGKWLLVLSPIFLSAVAQNLDSNLNGALARWFSEVFRALQGMGDDPNALIGALSMAACAAVLFALAFLMMRNAPVKEQDR